jgi:hypothetical protein
MDERISDAIYPSSGDALCWMERVGRHVDRVLPFTRGVAMQIEFPDHRPVFNYEDLTIEFAVVVNGRPIDCAVSAEALEDHFGAYSARADDLLHAFEHGRSHIEALTRQYLTMGLAGPVLLRSGHFRWVREARRQEAGR